MPFGVVFYEPEMIPSIRKFRFYVFKTKFKHIFSLVMIMKKLILTFIFFLIFQTSVHALETSAESACLMLADTREVIYEKNAYEKLPMASTTKIATAAVALEKSAPDDIVTVSANAESQEGSSIYLSRGDGIRMEDLLYGLMLNSGNDAAVAVAEHISGNVDDFALEMTALAKKAGADNTSFKNPNGLDEEGHYTTAYDLALITNYAMKNPAFRKIVSAKEKSVTLQNGNILYFSNHNKLLNMYEGVIGVKTGYTKKCGRCLVSFACKNGINLIAVTLNAPDDWNDHTNMLNYGFSAAENLSVASPGQVIKTVYTSDNREVGCVLKDGITIPAFNEKLPENELVTHLPAALNSPLKKGEKIGEAEFIVNGCLYNTTDILCDRNISYSRKTFKSSFSRVIKRLRKLYLQ